MRGSGIGDNPTKQFATILQFTRFLHEYKFIHQYQLAFPFRFLGFFRETSCPVLCLRFPVESLMNRIFGKAGFNVTIKSSRTNENEFKMVLDDFGRRAMSDFTALYVAEPSFIKTGPVLYQGFLPIAAKKRLTYRPLFHSPTVSLYSYCGMQRDAEEYFLCKDWVRLCSGFFRAAADQRNR